MFFASETWQRSLATCTLNFDAADTWLHGSPRRAAPCSRRQVCRRISGSCARCNVTMPRKASETVHFCQAPCLARSGQRAGRHCWAEQMVSGDPRPRSRRSHPSLASSAGRHCLENPWRTPKLRGGPQNSAADPKTPWRTLKLRGGPQNSVADPKTPWRTPKLRGGPQNSVADPKAPWRTPKLRGGPLQNPVARVPSATRYPPVRLALARPCPCRASPLLKVKPPAIPPELALARPGPAGMRPPSESPGRRSRPSRPSRPDADVDQRNAATAGGRSAPLSPLPRPDRPQGSCAGARQSRALTFPMPPARRDVGCVRAGVRARTTVDPDGRY